MNKIEQHIYDGLRIDGWNKELLFDILSTESFRWSQNIKNWFIKRNLDHIYDSITSHLGHEPTSGKNLYDFCKGTPPSCVICSKEARFKSFKEGYALCCESKKCHHAQISQRQQGTKNTCHRMTSETREQNRRKQSESLRKTILKGYTPKITNSWANSRCRIEESNISFRSTWEAMFYLLTKLPYERIRIPYTNEKGKDSVYIVDFHDEEKKILYEVKPISNKESKRCVLKNEAALKWCKENGYVYRYIDEIYLSDKKDDIRLLTYNDKILKALERLP